MRGRTRAPVGDRLRARGLLSQVPLQYEVPRQRCFHESTHSNVIRSHFGTGQSVMSYVKLLGEH